MDSHSTAFLCWTALCVFLMGMGKGGFPVGAVALPTLVLIWPSDVEPAKQAVAFMLPLLCVMDFVAMGLLYRKVMWKRLLPLLPGSVAGIAVASLLFVPGSALSIHVPDRGVKLLIGLIGILFVAYQFTRAWIIKRMGAGFQPGMAVATVFGVTAGVTSTIAHAAGPIMQMYLLPQKLEKLQFAATNTAYFLVINLLKMIPFALFGRIQAENLRLGAWMLPVVPLGVGFGYLLVRMLRPQYYVGLIYAILSVTSIFLIWQSL